MTTIEDVLNHIRGEYLEMPGLRLKPEQVARLCGIDQTMCQRALDSLLTSNFLCLRPDGAYARATDGYHPHRVPVKATAGNARAKTNRMSRSM
jgi:hypothetical protein